MNSDNEVLRGPLTLRDFYDMFDFLRLEPQPHPAIEVRSYKDLARALELAVGERFQELYEESGEVLSVTLAGIPVFLNPEIPETAFRLLSPDERNPNRWSWFYPSGYLPLPERIDDQDERPFG